MDMNTVSVIPLKYPCNRLRFAYTAGYGFGNTIDSKDNSYQEYENERAIQYQQEKVEKIEAPLPLATEQASPVLETPATSESIADAAKKNAKKTLL